MKKGARNQRREGKRRINVGMEDERKAFAEARKSMVSSVFLALPERSVSCIY